MTRMMVLMKGFPNLAIFATDSVGLPGDGAFAADVEAHRPRRIGAICYSPGVRFCGNDAVNGLR